MNVMEKAKQVAERLRLQRIVEKDGMICWFLDGERHREDGPAVERSDGTRMWFQYGKRHKENGPAVIYPDGEKQWWVNGRFIKLDSWEDSEL